MKIIRVEDCLPQMCGGQGSAPFSGGARKGVRGRLRDFDRDEGPVGEEIVLITELIADFGSIPWSSAFRIC